MCSALRGAWQVWFFSTNFVPLPGPFHAARCGQPRLAQGLHCWGQRVDGGEQRCLCGARLSPRPHGATGTHWPTELGQGPSTTGAGGAEHRLRVLLGVSRFWQVPAVPPRSAPSPALPRTGLCQSRCHCAEQGLAGGTPGARGLREPPAPGGP